MARFAPVVLAEFVHRVGGVLAERGAERGLFIVVQKTSTLILQAFASLVDLEGERLVTHTELSFRGDNDESWQKAAHFLAEKLAAEGSEG